MLQEKEDTIEFYIRTSFAILVFKVIFLQLIIGVFYFMFLFVMDLTSEGITSTRLIIFFIFQLFQAAFSVFIFLEWFYICYEISDKQIICHKGVVAKNTECYSLEKAEKVKLRQGFMGVIFKYGTLDIILNHSDNTDVVSIQNIPNPRRHAKIIEKGLKSFL